jgi:hypothetical protein
MTLFLSVLAVIGLACYFAMEWYVQDVAEEKRLLVRDDFIEAAKQLEYKPVNLKVVQKEVVEAPVIEAVKAEYEGTEAETFANNLYKELMNEGIVDCSNDCTQPEFVAKGGYREDFHPVDPAYYDSLQEPSFDYEADSSLDDYLRISDITHPIMGANTHIEHPIMGHANIHVKSDEHPIMGPSKEPNNTEEWIGTVIGYEDSYIHFKHRDNRVWLNVGEDRIQKIQITDVLKIKVDVSGEKPVVKNIIALQTGYSQDYCIPDEEHCSDYNQVMGL